MLTQTHRHTDRILSEIKRLKDRARLLKCTIHNHSQQFAIHNNLPFTSDHHRTRAHGVYGNRTLGKVSVFETLVTVYFKWIHTLNGYIL